MAVMTAAGHPYELDRRSVQAALDHALPEPVQKHFVVISGRHWPPKQVLGHGPRQPRRDRRD